MAGRNSAFWIIGGVVLLMLTKQFLYQVRGLRNNNPLNIVENDRVDYDWKGEHVLNLDDKFEEFISPEYGLRAAGKILDTYRKKGFKSIGQIISRWAPRNENDTDSYIKHVVAATGWVATYEPGRQDYPALVAVMVEHENGFNPYNQEFISNSLEIV